MSMDFEAFEESFFKDSDAEVIAKKLIGHFLVTNIGGIITAGMIVETEAYVGPQDKASHAYGNKYTHRTSAMFSKGGRAYVYLCYGIHRLFNVVCGPEGIPMAALIRAVEPIEGLQVMAARKSLKQSTNQIGWTSGPGLLTEALGIGLNHNGEYLCDSNAEVFLARNRSLKVDDSDLIIGPRVGIAYAEEWVDKPLRFQLRSSLWINKAK